MKKDQKILIAILLLAFIAFSSLLKAELTNWDDELYVKFNQIIRDFSPEGIREIFTSYVVGNYHPLTILSYTIEYTLFGLDAFIYHFTNIMLHLLNTVLVFYFIKGFSSNRNIAAITAILFAIHPLHVESVAWVSARKDLLYTCFFLLSLIYYIKYINNKLQAPSPKSRDSNFQIFKFSNYFLSLLFFLFSCLSKAMAVTLPLVLLLIDYHAGRNVRSYRTLIEKIPFFVISIVIGIVAVIAQRSAEAFTSIESYTILERILFSSYSFCAYIYNLFIPTNLSSFYPYPAKPDGVYPGLFYLAPLAVIALAYFSYRYLLKSRDALFGALFFLLNIILVLQLIPVGEAMMADRYTYLSYIGLFYVLSYYMIKIFAIKKPVLQVTKPTKELLLFRFKPVVIAILSAGIIIFFFVTNKRCKAWQNSFVLWSDVISKYDNVWKAYNNRGLLYLHSSKPNEAFNDFNKAVSTAPLQPKVIATLYSNRSVALTQMGEHEKALEDISRAINLAPKNAETYTSRANIYSNRNMVDSALIDLNTAILLDSTYARSYFLRGKIYASIGDEKSAFEDMIRLVRYDPLGYPAAYNNISVYLIKGGEYKKALPYVDKAIEFSPGFARAYYNRSIVHFNMMNYEAAYRDASKAKELGYEMDEAYYKSIVEKYE